MKFNDTHDSFLFFVIVILGRYLGSNISCETRDILNNNLFARQILLFLFIFVAMMLKVDKIDSVSQYFLNTVKIWLVALLFTKLNVYSMIGVLGIFSISKLLEKKTYDDDPKKNFLGISKKRAKEIIKIHTRLAYFLVFASSAISYIVVDKNNLFSHLKYLFGGYGCKNPEIIN